MAHFLWCVFASASAVLGVALFMVSNDIEETGPSAFAMVVSVLCFALSLWIITQ